MVTMEEQQKWLRRGRQRMAVARVLRKPMTAVSICRAARAFAPQVQLRDVWFLMKQFEERDLVVGLNGRQAKGRLYFLTEAGRALVWKAFGISVEPLSADVDWRRYAWTFHAKIRRVTLLALSRTQARTGTAQTAAVVRRALRDDCAVGLNPVIRALKELTSRGLVQFIGFTKLGNRRLYQVTPTGKRIVQALLQ